MYDILIIGAGPAGIAAAIYAIRNNLKVAVFEGDAPGGKMVYTATVENYPGYSSIEGPDLALEMFNQIMNLGVEYLGANAVRLEKFEDHFNVYDEYDKKYQAKKIIIASGTKDKKLGIPGEEKFTHKGISWCAICDGSLYRGKEVAVVGGGNSALEETIYLSGVASHVYLIHRRDEFRAEPVIVDKVKGLKNVSFIFDTEVKEFIGDDSLGKIRLVNNKTNKENFLEVSACFEYVGQLPNTDFVRDFGITNENNYILVDDNMETEVKGLYSVGDVNDKKVRQIVTAVNDGAIASLHIIKEIR